MRRRGTGWTSSWEMVESLVHSKWEVLPFESLQMATLYLSLGSMRRPRITFRMIWLRRQEVRPTKEMWSSYAGKPLASVTTALKHRSSARAVPASLGAGSLFRRREVLEKRMGSGSIIGCEGLKQVLACDLPNDAGGQLPNRAAAFSSAGGVGEKQASS